MKHYLLLLLAICLYSNLIAQDIYTVSGKIFDGYTEEPLTAVTILANCDSTVIITSSEDNGAYKLILPCRTDTIFIKYFGFGTKKIVPDFNGEKELELNAFLDPKNLKWEKESFEYDDRLTGIWKVKNFTLKDDKRPNFTKKGYTFCFGKAKYDRLGYGDFSYSDGCNGTNGIYYRITNNNELEFKSSFPQTTLVGCRYKRRKNEKINSKYNGLLLFNMINKIVKFEIVNNKLYINFENNQLVLEK